jgi:hypothetical protein
MRYLPPEIWDLIAHFLHRSEPEYSFLGPYDSQSITRLCLTSKTLNQYCTAVLYRNIVPSLCGGKKLFHTLVQNPTLAAYVKSLRLTHGRESLFVKRADLTPAVQIVCDQYFKTLKGMLSASTGSSLTAWNQQGIESVLQHECVDRSEILSSEACESILLSTLPNLRELDLDTEAFVPGVPPRALARLSKCFLRQALYGKPIVEFTNLRFLAEAATSLSTLSLIGVVINFYDDGWGSSMTPMFPTVTNLNISACDITRSNFYELEVSAAEFIRSFPRLTTFRFQAYGRIEIPCKPKIQKLLQALRHNAPQLKHLCLEELVTTREIIVTGEDPITMWEGALDELSRLKPLRHLTIDIGSLCETALLKDHHPLWLVGVLPENLHHLHLLADETRWVDLDHLEESFCELARVIIEEKRYTHLKRITFKSKILRGRIGRALDALKKAGVSMVRQATVWNDEEGPYNSK